MIRTPVGALAEDKQHPVDSRPPNGSRGANVTPTPPQLATPWRAVFVYEALGTELGSIRSSADRAVTFFIDAPMIAELDDIEARVRRAVTIHTAPRPLPQG